MFKRAREPDSAVVKALARNDVEIHNLRERLDEALTQLREIKRATDSVHPDELDAALTVRMQSVFTRLDQQQRLLNDLSRQVDVLATRGAPGRHQFEAAIDKVYDKIADACEKFDGRMLRLENSFGETQQALRTVRNIATAAMKLATQAMERVKKKRKKRRDKC